MNLIIVSSLTCDEGLYFRFLTMTAKKDLKYDVLIEAELERIDYYYRLLKIKGWFDFVDDFVEPRHRTEGVRIDPEINYARTIRTPYIRNENVLNLVGQLKQMKEITF